MQREKDNYSGMTLNEMLFDSGLMKDFDEAMAKKDKRKLLKILAVINIKNNVAEKIIDTIFNNPKRYGFSPDK